jgi:large-conductance mechanosensitive channel
MFPGSVCNTLVVERAWILLSIVLVAALVFIVCALTLFVMARFVPKPQAKAAKSTATDADALPAGPASQAS